MTAPRVDDRSSSLREIGNLSVLLFIETGNYPASVRLGYKKSMTPRLKFDPRANKGRLQETSDRLKACLLRLVVIGREPLRDTNGRLSLEVSAE